MNFIVEFFTTMEPIALDPIVIPWLKDFVGGNIVTGTVVWAILKYIAQITPWATDDKILQIFTGAVKAAKDAFK